MPLEDEHVHSSSLKTMELLTVVIVWHQVVIILGHNLVFIL